MSTRGSLRKAILLAVSAIFFGVNFGAHGAAQEPSEIRHELKNNAQACIKNNLPECVSVCVKAAKMVEQDSPEFQGLLDQCRELHRPVAPEPYDPAKAVPDNSILREGFTWMPDVTAVVGSQPNGRSYPIMAEGRNDWNRHCSRSAYKSAGKQHRAFSRPGTRIHFSQIQYNNRGCIIGQYEILGQ